MSESAKVESKSASKANPNTNWFEKIVGMGEEDFQKSIAMNEVRS
jgi:hypothetical protein